MIPNNFTQSLEPYVKFIPICPEVEIGLGIPRDVIRVVQSKRGHKKLVQPSTDRDLTKKMSGFSNKFLNSLEAVDGFILKARSPSCGIRNTKYYRDKTSETVAHKGPGLFTEKVLEQFPGMAIEDEERLRNLRIREHFLLKLFTLARFREIKTTNSVGSLVRFHSENKYLLMTYDQREMRAMDRTLLNENKLTAAQVIREYERRLHRALSHIPKRNSNINTLVLAMGYFENNITSEEKRFFADRLQDYRGGIIPLSTVNAVMRSWIIKYEVTDIWDQSYFAPYPKELMQI